MYVEKISSTKTKKNDTMYFITGSDDTATCEFILFPNNDIEINSKNIYLTKGKVEKRYDKYQIIINQIRRIEWKKDLHLLKL